MTTAGLVKPDSKALAQQQNAGLDGVELMIGTGDLSKLQPAERVRLYKEVCQSLGLNPLTRPFEYLMLNGKMTLYCRKDATDQLRKINQISITIVGRDRVEDVYIVTARATMPNGRIDEATGVVTIGNLKGDALCNSLMKAETKAKRRVTLSIAGLGFTDETEVETIQGAQFVQVSEHGEIVSQSPAKALPKPAPKTLPEPVEPEPEPATEDQLKQLRDLAKDAGFAALPKAQEMFPDLEVLSQLWAHEAEELIKAWSI